MDDRYLKWLCAEYSFWNEVRKNDSTNYAVAYQHWDKLANTIKQHLETKRLHASLQ